MQPYPDQLITAGKSPKNFGDLPGATHTHTQHNAFCGDTLHISLIVSDGHIERSAFTGQGCLLCMASASIMTQHLQGRAVESALHLSEVVQHQNTHASDDVRALIDARKIAGRAMCVKLPWLAVDKLLTGGH